MSSFFTCGFSVFFFCFLPSEPANDVPWDVFWWIQNFVFCTVLISSDNICYVRRWSSISSYQFNNIFVVTHGVLFTIFGPRRLALLSCVIMWLVPLPW